MADQEDRIWEALKSECCADPSKAKRIVMLTRDAFNRALSAARAEGPGSPVTVESVARVIEDIICRRLHQQRLDGYTLEASREIAEALALIAPAGRGGGRDSAACTVSAATGGPTPAAPEAEPSGLAEAALWMRDEATAMRRGADLLVGGTRNRALANADDLERWAAMIEVGV